MKLLRIQLNAAIESLRQAVCSMGRMDRHADAGRSRACGRSFLRAGICPLLAVLLLAGPGAFSRSSRGATAEITAEEAVLKATYLVKFCLFTEWPSGSFSKPESPFVIGVLGRSEIAVELEKIAVKRTIDARKVVIRRLTPNSDFSDCQAVFIGREHDFAPVLPKLKAVGVLTVGEHEKFAQRGGIINFVPVKESLRYDVNKGAAQKAGLTISSQMLGFARALVSSEAEKREP